MKETTAPRMKTTARSAPEVKTMVTEPAYRSDTRPDFAPFEESLGSIHGFDFAGDAGSEIAAGKLTARRRSICSTTCWPSASSRR
jgi:hypothetical protein